MAEALLNHLGQGRFRAYSAGSMPKGAVHPHTLRLLHPPGHDYFAVLRRKLRWSEQP